MNLLDAITIAFQIILKTFCEILKYFNFQLMNIDFFNETVFDSLYKYEYFPFINELNKTKSINSNLQIDPFFFQTNECKNHKIRYNLCISK